VPKAQLGHYRAERVGADIPDILSIESIEAACSASRSATGHRWSIDRRPAQAMNLINKE
jgi:hypothetical protein